MPAAPVCIRLAFSACATRQSRSESGEDSERYAYPPPLNDPGFFEDFFDSKPEAVKTFWRVVNERLAKVANVA